LTNPPECAEIDEFGNNPKYFEGVLCDRVIGKWVDCEKFDYDDCKTDCNDEMQDCNDKCYDDYDDCLKHHDPTTCDNPAVFDVFPNAGIELNTSDAGKIIHYYSVDRGLNMEEVKSEELRLRDLTFERPEVKICNRQGVCDWI
jgi:hypothetical protein